MATQTQPNGWSPITFFGTVERHYITNRDGEPLVIRSGENAGKGFTRVLLAGERVGGRRPSTILTFWAEPESDEVPEVGRQVLVRCYIDRTSRVQVDGFEYADEKEGANA